MKKYKCAGLVEILNVAKKVDACILWYFKKVMILLYGFVGLCYCMVVGVMFNYIGVIW